MTGTPDILDRIDAETSESRREEILTKGWDVAVLSLYEEIKATGEHGDYQRLIFESWILDGKDDLLLEARDEIKRLRETVSDLNPPKPLKS